MSSLCHAVLSRVNWCHMVFCRISESSIVCKSEGLADVNRTGPVVVAIDNDEARGVDFTFRNDPVFTSVSPRIVIPA